MNGFTNTILTLMLSWLRALINNIWKLLGSDDGNNMLRFLSNHWKLLVLILCVGGFIIDRVIYFIRWRPHYMWSSKLNRLRTRRNSENPREESEQRYRSKQTAQPQHSPQIYQPENYEAEAQNDYYTRPYQAPYTGLQSNLNATQAQTATYMSPMNAAPTDFSQTTVHYAPIAQRLPKEHTSYQQSYQPPQNFEPVFDDDLGSWEEGSTTVRPLSDHAYQNPANGMESAFGMPKPEPIDYIRDMQAGFAPQVKPEMLYTTTKPTSPALSMPPADLPDSVPTGPVHPGLGSEMFRQSFGLTPTGTLLPSAQSHTNADDLVGFEDKAYGNAFEQGTMHTPSFIPYAQRLDYADEKPSKPRNPFAGIAKKARDLVGVEDENNRPTIHDLQPSVDMRTAFHEPVYPKPKDGKGDER